MSAPLYLAAMSPRVCLTLVSVSGFSGAPPSSGAWVASLGWVLVASQLLNKHSSTMPSVWSCGIITRCVRYILADCFACLIGVFTFCLRLQAMMQRFQLYFVDIIRSTL